MIIFNYFVNNHHRSLNEENVTLKDTKTLLENDLDEMELLLNAKMKTDLL